MNLEDQMPVGDCVVCGETVDHSEMGNCGTCGNVFHWRRCGEWGDNEHICNLCKKVADEKEKIDQERPSMDRTSFVLTGNMKKCPNCNYMHGTNPFCPSCISANHTGSGSESD